MEVEGQITKNPVDDKVRQDHLSELAGIFAQSGVVFEAIPQAIYPGMPYITPARLVETGVTSYTVQHIHALIRRGNIPSHTIGKQRILDPQGVSALIEYEKQSIDTHPHTGGRLPGVRNRFGIRERE